MFFVISGYLITTIIISEMAEGKFSIVNFYERRARRILPALFFVMLVCIPFAWFWMLPKNLLDFGGVWSQYQLLYLIYSFGKRVGILQMRLN